MNHLVKPRHPIVERALGLARQFCEEQVIDDAPAIAHAVKVATILVRHVPDATPEMIAAALLHDAPLFVSPTADLDELLTHAVADGVAPIVKALHVEHEAMMSGTAPRVPERPVALIMAADKVVAFRALVERAHRAADEREFWSRRGTLRGLLPWFAEWCNRATPLLPGSLTFELAVAFERLESRSHLGGIGRVSNTVNLDHPSNAESDNQPPRWGRSGPQPPGDSSATVDLDIQLSVGQILVFEEGDYLYGQGDLVFRLTRGGTVKGRMEWLRLVGERIRRDGTVERLVDGTVQQVSVRASALTEAIRLGAARPRRPS